MARGAFPRAEVTKGIDWDYEDDDGKLTVRRCLYIIQLCTCIIIYIVHVHVLGGEGKTGKVVILKDWNESSFVSDTQYYNILHVHARHSAFHLAQRSAIDVTWTATDKTIKCRLGHDGKVNIYAAEVCQLMMTNYYWPCMSG